ncbi:unnamed protein product, partial [Adineta ricciae]
YIGKMTGFYRIRWESVGVCRRPNHRIPIGGSECRNDHDTAEFWRIRHFPTSGAACRNPVKWTFETNGPIFSSPCLFGDKLFIGCHDEYLYAVNLSNEQQGVLEWKYRFPSMIYASPFVFDHGRMVIVGSMNGCLRALTSQTGEILCETQIPGEGLFSSPICYRDRVIVGSRDDYLYCYTFHDSSK